MCVYMFYILHVHCTVGVEWNKEANILTFPSHDRFTSNIIYTSFQMVGEAIQNMHTCSSEYNIIVFLWLSKASGLLLWEL